MHPEIAQALQHLAKALRAARAAEARCRPLQDQAERAEWDGMNHRQRADEAGDPRSGLTQEEGAEFGLMADASFAEADALHDANRANSEAHAAAKLSVAEARRQLGAVLNARLIDAAKAPESRDSVVTQWGEILAGWREAESLSLRELAERAGVTSATISRYETGSRTPTIDRVREQISALEPWLGAAGAHPESGGGSKRLGAYLYVDDPEGQVELFDTLQRGLANDVEALEIEELYVLSRLAKSPEALRAILMQEPPRDRLRDALAAVPFDPTTESGANA